MERVGFWREEGNNWEEGGAPCDRPFYTAQTDRVEKEEDATAPKKGGKKKKKMRQMVGHESVEGFDKS